MAFYPRQSLSGRSHAHPRRRHDGTGACPIACVGNHHHYTPCSGQLRISARGEISRWPPGACPPPPAIDFEKPSSHGLRGAGTDGYIYTTWSRARRLAWGDVDPPTLHPERCTLHPTPCTLHPAPCTLYPTPCTLHPAPYTLHPSPSTQQTKPLTINPQPYPPQIFEPSPSNPTPQTANRKPKAQNPEPQIPNPEPRQGAPPHVFFSVEYAISACA